MASFPKRDVDANMELAKAMNTVVTAMNDESAEEVWLYVWPDGADDDDVREMADDPEMMELLCKGFRSLVGSHGRAGFCPGAGLEAYGCD